MSKPPNKIWLQWNCGEHDPDWGQPEPGDVTWCADKQFDDDVAYSRVRYRSAVSGLWYDAHEAAGDVCAIEVDGRVWRTAD